MNGALGWWRHACLAGLVIGLLASPHLALPAGWVPCLLAAVLGGIDGLVFTAGIGENSAEVRRRIAEASAWLGIELDQEANARHELRISQAGSPVSAWVIPTNEELMIARHTGRILSLIEARP